MAGFVEGVDRGQSTLFPALLDDYVAEDNPVRAVDVFVDGLDLDKLGFVGVQPLETGRPGYHPGMMLKLYIYGYLNRVPSSRRLERECQRNIEMIWLTGQLAPDFKTIADFRKDNGKAIREVCREFVALCRKLDLLVAASVAIDGSQFKAVNARDKNFTEAKMKRRLERIDESIARYLSQLETADRHGDAVPEAKVARFHEVTNVGTDRHQLANMAGQARDEMAVEMLEVVADRGYYDGDEIRACEEADITVTLPKPMTSGAKAAGRFGKQDFVYVAADDVYRCPAGERLTYHYTNVEDGKILRRYWTSSCKTCALKAQCTTGPERRISRWEHEAVLEKVQDRLDHNPNAMGVRRQTAEHPFGTMKCWMGATHFLTKKLPKVATEMTLTVLAYNMKRVMTIMGVGGLLEATRA
ncbi:transposase [Bradyrhizobium sp. USDA 10063]